MMLKKSLLALIIASVSATSMAGNVEVLHWWTAGGEAKAAASLKAQLEAQGHTWEDFAVAGGGGEAAMTVLKSRAVSGNPPEAAQIKGPEIQDWADQGFLTNLDQVAQAENWDNLIPAVVADVMKYDGHYVAVPVNVHRVNWIWANPTLLEKAGVKLPSTWDEFFTVAETLKTAGIIPLAHGGQAWQDATVFEDMLLGLKGAEFYQKALVDLDADALASEDMIAVLTQFRRLKDYMDPNFSGREWNAATNMVMTGEAAMQIMGDWAKGELSAAKLVPGVDILCAPSPGTADSFLFNVDSLAMFEVANADNQVAQRDLARLVLAPEFQQTFNLNKGSIPVRAGMDLAAFDQCAKDSASLFAQAAKAGTLKPSMAHGMAVSPGAQGAIFDVVTHFLIDDKLSPEEAAKRMAKAVQSAL